MIKPSKYNQLEPSNQHVGATLKTSLVIFVFMGLFAMFIFQEKISLAHDFRKYSYQKIGELKYSEFSDPKHAKDSFFKKRSIVFGLPSTILHKEVLAPTLKVPECQIGYLETGDHLSIYMLAKRIGGFPPKVHDCLSFWEKEDAMKIGKIALEADLNKTI